MLLIGQGALLFAAVISSVDTANVRFGHDSGTFVWAVILAAPSTALGLAFVQGRSPRRSTFSLELLLGTAGVTMVFAYTQLVGTYDISKRAPEALLASALAVVVALWNCQRLSAPGTPSTDRKTRSGVDLI